MTSTGDLDPLTSHAIRPAVGPPQTAESAGWRSGSGPVTESADRVANMTPVAMPPGEGLYIALNLRLAGAGRSEDALRHTGGGHGFERLTEVNCATYLPYLAMSMKASASGYRIWDDRTRLASYSGSCRPVAGVGQGRPCQVRRGLSGVDKQLRQGPG